MTEDKEPPQDSVELKVSFRIPARMPTLYAHHLMIQPGEHEVLLSFFEVIPPPAVAKDADQMKKLQESGVIAECIARITIAKDRFPSFAKAMQDILVIDRPTANEEVTDEYANDQRNNTEGK